MNIYILSQLGTTLCSLSNDSDSLNAHIFYDAVLQRNLTTPDTFEFTCVMNHKNSKHIAVNNNVAFKYRDSYHLFKIMEIEEAHSEKHTVTCYCEGASLELLNSVVLPSSNPAQTPTQCLRILLASTDWKIGNVDEFETKDIEFSGYKTVLEELENIAEIYGAQINYRISYDAGIGIRGKYIDFLENRGKSKGVRFEYGVNSSDVSKKVDASNVCSAVIPIGTQELTIANIVCDKARHGFDKPKGTPYVELDELERSQLTQSPYHIFSHITVDTDDPYKLAIEGWKYLQENKTPKIDYTFSPSLLTQEVDIADTVCCVDRDMGLTLEAIVSQMEIHFDGTEDSITLSNYVVKESHIDEALINSIQQQIKDVALEKEIIISDKMPSVEEGKGIVWIDTGTNSNVANIQTWTGEEWINHINGLDTVDVYYYLSSSSEELKGGVWQTTPPKWQYGTYMWTKTVTMFTSGLVTESTPVCVQGHDGKGILRIIEQYYLSTSDVEPLHGEWTNSQPTWEDGKFIWTRSYIEWVDGTNTTTEPQLASAINLANLNAMDAKETAELAQIMTNSLNNKVNGMQNTINGVEASIVEWCHEEDRTLIDGSKIYTGTINAKHIKSLNGLNVNNKFIVTEDGDVQFKGDLTGATGTFSGTVTCSTEARVGANIYLGHNQDARGQRSIRMYGEDGTSTWIYTVDDGLVIDTQGTLELRGLDINIGNWEYTTTTISGDLIVNGQIIQNNNVASVSTLSLDNDSKILYTSDGLCMTSGETITPSKALNECTNGWVLIWSRCENGVVYDDNINFWHIPKTTEYFTSLTMDMAKSMQCENVTVNKRLNVNNTTLSGNDNNSLAQTNTYNYFDNSKLVLRWVMEY